MPTIRRFLEEGSGMLTVRNDSLSSQDLFFLHVPEWLYIENELPSVLLKDTEVDITVNWDSSYKDGFHEGTIQLSDENSLLFELEVQGEIEPYIQLNVQEFPEIRGKIIAEFINQNLVGAAVGIVEGQDIVFLEGFGYADLENEILVDPSVHRMRWASVAKSITAVLALQHAQAGVLSLDDSIEHLYPEYQEPAMYLPEGWMDVDSAVLLPEESNSLSLHMLLSHTGCVQHYNNGVVDPEPSAADRNDPVINTGMEWALEYWKEAPLICVPGTEFSYSTFGYNLVGVALESLTGESFETLVTEGISDVVGSWTLLPDRHWDPAPDRVIGYNRDDGIVSRGGDSDVSWKLAGGGFTSTPEDLARYCAGLLGEELVEPTLRDDELWHVQPETESYGLGFYVYGDYITHSGSQQSTKTALFIDRQQNRCIIAMSNSTWAEPFGLIWAAISQ